MDLERSGLERRAVDEPDRQVGFREARAAVGVEERRDMAAVDVIEAAVRSEAQDAHGGVLLDVLAADIAVDDFSDGGEGLARGELRIDQALQSGGQDRGGDSLAGDVGDDHGEGVVVLDDVEEIASHFAAGDGARGDLRPGKGGQAGGHEAALDFGGDVQLFAVAALALFGQGELRVVDEGGGVGGDGAEQVVVHLGEAARLEAAVEIEEAEEVGVAGAALAVFAQRDTDDGADAVGDDGSRAVFGVGAEGVSEDVFAGVVNGLADGAVGEGLLVGEFDAVVVAAEGELEFAQLVAQEDKAAFELRELDGGVDEGAKDLIDGAGGLQLAGGLEEPVELLEGVAGEIG